MKPRLRLINGGILLAFACPGCGDTHHVDPQRWTWNGDLAAPTFRPSLLVTSGHYVVGRDHADPCWCGRGYDFVCYRCHSYITDGHIQFLDDSTHHLAGKTVDLADVTP